MKADAATEAAVLGVLDEFMQSYEQRDIERLLSFVSPDDDLFLFGTGLDEKRTGRKELKFQAERDWSQTERLAFNLTWHRVSVAGPVAWIASEGLGQGQAGGQEFQFPVRGTFVWEQRGDNWFLVQSHFSLPAPAQEEGDSVPV
jgi:ketosteroid isomerase-like protein